ncbi:MAG TPA: efflux RND transporter periplasmic adaptor subunit [Pyrinomonadaceae bacterium]|nr:efflux RND transporter periplasmic adaptor subunit [Pyrinomonadaceae bacterium]
MISREQFKILTLALVLAVAALSLAACGGSKAQSNAQQANVNAAAPAAVDITTAPAITRDLPRFFEATGSLAADEQTDVAPSISGKVVAVGVELGSYVRQGQMIVKLDDNDARIRLEQTIAQLSQAQAAARQAEAKIGLRAGQPFDPTRVADVGSARVALELADKQLRRFERLLETGDVSRSSYDQQKAQRDQLKEQYDLALNRARQDYASVEASRAAVTNAETQVAQARRNLSYALVYSPINGYVAERPADLGEYVSPATKVATVVSTNPLRVRIDIPEQALSAIQVGQSVSVNVSAYPDRSFSGRVHHVAPSVTPNSRTLTVEAEVENNDGLLRPGQFATVRVLQPQTSAAVLVPARSVRAESGTNYVFIIRDGRAEKRIVQLGQTEADLIEIKSGVTVGEQVATSNVELLSDGVPVRQ